VPGVLAESPGVEGGENERPAGLQLGRPTAPRGGKRRRSALRGAGSLYNPPPSSRGSRGTEQQAPHIRGNPSQQRTTWAERDRRRTSQDGRGR
jgi:hypothetical protein